jgi:ATP-dependent RNA helicase DHX36
VAFCIGIRCLDPVLSIVSLLSFKSPFVMPLEKKDEANRAKLRLSDEQASDHRVRDHEIL